MKFSVLLSLGFAFSCLVAPDSFARVPGKCENLHWQPNQIYTVKAALHHGTHIILPEKIMGNPITGNIDLWQVEGQGNHVFIKPTTTEKEGAQTTMTVIDRNNKSYDFLLQRVDKNPDVCLQIELDGDFIQGSTLSGYRSPQEQMNFLLQEKVASLQEQVIASNHRARDLAGESLQKYRSYIYTRYKWSGGRGFLGKDIVSDVWDDGRFTFVRLFDDNRGTMTVMAKVDGSEEFIEYGYDAENKIYQISGIFPEFIMKYGDSKVEIERQDNVSNGSY